MDVTSKEDVVKISLSQPDTRADQNQSNKYIGMRILQVKIEFVSRQQNVLLQISVVSICSCGNVGFILLQKKRDEKKKKKKNRGSEEARQSVALGEVRKFRPGFKLRLLSFTNGFLTL